jgi:spermidine synthase
MSLVWERRVGDRLYQVRRAGRSLRLYTNGVFHSQYNPARPVTGSVWDLLLLPAFFYPTERLRRILVLGVGGGAVIQQLRQFVRPDMLVGVELSQVHLSIARRIFGVCGDDVQLVRANAVDWVKHYRGSGFDMIIDDLFADYDGQPQRSVCANKTWVNSLYRCLNPGGMMVSNFATSLELESSAYRLEPACRRWFAAAFKLDTAQNHNAVGVFLTRHVTTRQLRERLKRIPVLDPRKAAGLRYRIRTLRP